MRISLSIKLKGFHFCRNAPEGWKTPGEAWSKIGDALRTAFPDVLVDTWCGRDDNEYLITIEQLDSPANGEVQA